LGDHALGYWVFFEEIWEELKPVMAESNEFLRKKKVLKTFYFISLTRLEENVILPII